MKLLTCDELIALLDSDGEAIHEAIHELERRGFSVYRRRFTGTGWCVV